MNRLAIQAQTFPQEWKWAAIFAPPAGFEAEWRTWLAQAQAAEEATLLAWWAHRPSAGRDAEGDGGDLLAA